MGRMNRERSNRGERKRPKVDKPDFRTKEKGRKKIKRVKMKLPRGRERRLDQTKMGTKRKRPEKGTLKEDQA